MYYKWLNYNINPVKSIFQTSHSKTHCSLTVLMHTTFHKMLRVVCMHLLIIFPHSYYRPATKAYIILDWMGSPIQESPGKCLEWKILQGFYLQQDPDDTS